MSSMYLVVLLVHSVCVALLLKIAHAVLPCCVTCAYGCVANFLLFLVVCGATFRITKKKHLDERLTPDNRALLITGCDTGFGHLLAKHLDTQGYHVFASCLDENGAGAAELKKNSSKRLQILGLDVTSDDSVKKALQFVNDNLGTSELWCVVNNAGVHRGFHVELSSMDDFRQSIEVNSLGPIRVTKAFLPLLRQSRGRVINVTSNLGRIPFPYMTPYVVSKYAFVGFNDCLRQEMDPWGIRVISIEPEFFATDIMSDVNISRGVDQTFSSLEESVKSDYGDKYLKNFRIYSEYHAGMASDKLRRVISDLEDAVSLEEPDPAYRSSRSCLVKGFLYAYQASPHIFKDLLVKFLFYITGFPKPKEANDFS